MNDANPKFVVMVRRSRAFWLTGEVDPSLILGDGSRASKVMAAVQWWDETFWLAYRDFRMELRAIASDLYHQAGFDEILFWSDRSAVEELPPGTWLIPVDEDDWLSPDLVGTLRGVCSAPGPDVVTWSVVRKAADGTAKLDPNTFVESCGYAVRLPFDWDTVRSHMHLRPPRNRTVPITLAVRNETPASMSYLYRNPTENVLSVLRQAVSASNIDIPPNFRGAWLKYQQLLQRLWASRQRSNSARHDSILRTLDRT